MEEKLIDKVEIRVTKTTADKIRAFPREKRRKIAEKIRRLLDQAC